MKHHLTSSNIVLWLKGKKGKSEEKGVKPWVGSSLDRDLIVDTNDVKIWRAALLEKLQDEKSKWVC